jgi:hypothetical protein
MTIKEIKAKYGDADGYVVCYQCPCYGECEKTDFASPCDGFGGAYKRIQSFLDEKTPDEKATVVPNEDKVNHPSHYTQGGMECIDEMIALFGKEATMHFCLLNAWKYRKRALYKNGQQDMDKSDWYIAKYVELKKEGTKDET